jgi:hypothetical protein
MAADTAVASANAYVTLIQSTNTQTSGSILVSAGAQFWDASGGTGTSAAGWRVLEVSLDLTSTNVICAQAIYTGANTQAAPFSGSWAREVTATNIYCVQGTASSASDNEKFIVGGTVGSIVVTNGTYINFFKTQ